MPIARSVLSTLALAATVASVTPATAAAAPDSAIPSPMVLMAGDPCLQNRSAASPSIPNPAGDCVIARLRQKRFATDFSLSDVTYNAMALAMSYQAKSGVRQRNLDGLTVSTAVTSIGYLGSAGAGPTTVAIWGGGALTSVLGAQFTALEPNRDLYYGGLLGVDLISGRYNDVGLAIAKFEAVNESATGSEAIAACDRLDDQIRLVNQWPKDGADSLVILPEALKLATACDAFRSKLSDIDVYASALSSLSTRLPSMYSSDLISLDSAVLARGRTLRYTPLDTLSGIAASPFATLNTLLTGQDGAKAIASIKTQAAFEKLNIKLSSITLPELPKLETQRLSVLAGVSSRARISDDTRSKNDPKADEVASVARTMQETSRTLERARVILAGRLELLNPVAIAAGTDRLNFAYDAASRTVSVTLTAPASGQTPQVGGAPAT